MEHLRLSRWLIRPAMIAVLTALANSAVADINDLTNSTFDANLNGWTIFGLPEEAAWDALDVADSADSGSALLSQENAGFVTLLGQCVPVTPDVLHSMSSWIFVPGGQNADGRAGIEIEWFADANCNNADHLETVVRELDPLVEGGWTFLARGATAPADAVAALAMLRVKNNDGVFRWEAHFDDVPFGAGILPGMGFGLSATGAASVAPDGQGNFTVSGIGDTFDDGVDLGFGAGTVFEATDQPIITPGTLADAVTPSDLAGAVTPSDFKLELAQPLDAADFTDGAALLLTTHVLLAADAVTPSDLAGAVTPSDIRRAGLIAQRSTLQESAWFASPGGADIFPQGAHELVLRNNGQVVERQSQRTDPLPLSVIPRRLTLGLDRGRFELLLVFDDEQLIGDSLRFDEAIFRSEVSREARDFLPAVQLRAANLPAVQLADADIRSDTVRLQGLGRAIINLQPDGRLAIENFGGSGTDGLRIQPAGEPSTRARLEFDRSLPAGEVSGAVEGPQPCLLPGEPLARFRAADIGEVFETTAEFFGTGGDNSVNASVTGATTAHARQTAVQKAGASDASTLRIFDSGELVTEVEAFTGALRTARSLGSAYAAWVCNGGRLCNEFRWDEPIDMELDGAGTFTGDRLVWVLGDGAPLPPDIINGVEYFAADMPARNMTAARADDRVFADQFDG